MDTLPNFVLKVAATSGNYSWQDEYQFRDRPDANTLKLLLDDCAATFVLLYEGGPQSMGMKLTHLTPDERSSALSADIPDGVDTPSES